jgi:mRNA-degrading endonuclease YafQ of YafQ-DinJ toxin-antitoxin module
MKDWLNRITACLYVIGAVSLALAAEQDKQALEARARQFWEAEVKQDWGTVYDLSIPEERANATREQYVAFRREKGPFQYLTAQIGEVAVAGDIGWVQVAYDVRPLNYPEVKPHHIQIWDLWHKRDTWYPVPKPQRDQFPKLPPHLRPADEEAALSKRAHDYWQAKETQDWQLIYQYLTPDHRAQVSLEQFLKKKALFSYFSHRLEWTEVITDNRGRVKVVYRRKLNDPSVSKLDPQEDRVIENWIKIDNQWYRDLETTPKKANDPPGNNQAGERQ